MSEMTQSGCGSLPGIATLLTIRQRLLQITDYDRGARITWAEIKPVEPVWVMPAKGVLNAQNRFRSPCLQLVGATACARTAMLMPGIGGRLNKPPAATPPPLHTDCKRFHDAIWIVRRRVRAARLGCRRERLWASAGRRVPRRGRRTRLSFELRHRTSFHRHRSDVRDPDDADLHRRAHDAAPVGYGGARAALAYSGA